VGAVPSVIDGTSTIVDEVMCDVTERPEKMVQDVQRRSLSHPLVGGTVAVLSRHVCQQGLHRVLKAIFIYAVPPELGRISKGVLFSGRESDEEAQRYVRRRTGDGASGPLL
jgi:hypothetical protein